MGHGHGEQDRAVARPQRQVLGLGVGKRVSVGACLLAAACLLELEITLDATEFM